MDLPRAAIGQERQLRDRLQGCGLGFQGPERALGGVQLLILDDWGLAPLDPAARHDLLEILETRYGRRSTIITSQLPIEHWHAWVGDATIADAMLDRLMQRHHHG